MEKVRIVCCIHAYTCYVRRDCATNELYVQCTSILHIIHQRESINSLLGQLLSISWIQHSTLIDEINGIFTWSDFIVNYSEVARNTE